jgi:hypothetical protein
MTLKLGSLPIEKSTNGVAEPTIKFKLIAF